MPNQVETEAETEVVDDTLKTWQPSRRPEHQLPAADRELRGKIVEVGEDQGFLFALKRYFARPFVRLVTGLGLFILVAIVYDNTLNMGEWTIRQLKPKASEHRGAEPVPLTPGE